MKVLCVSRRVRVRAVRALVLMASIGWCAQGLAADAEARGRIAAERAQARADFVAQERDCRTRFAVTPCVEAARSRQREALGRLRREELLLDDARRRQRVAEHAAEIRRKVSAAQARERKSLAAAPVTPTPTPTASPASEANPRLAAPRVPSRKASPHAAGKRTAPDAAARRRGETQRRARDARNTAEFEARSRAARAHRDEVERRNAERAARGKKARPLPVPAGASTP